MIRILGVAWVFAIMSFIGWKSLPCIATDGCTGKLTNPRFEFATQSTKNVVKLCIGNFGNCEVMYVRGDKTHTPRVTACEWAPGLYKFCKPNNVAVLPTPRAAEAL